MHRVFNGPESLSDEGETPHFIQWLQAESDVSGFLFSHPPNRCGPFQPFIYSELFKHRLFILSCPGTFL